ncbi:MAG: hypothetical protein HYY37_03265 [Candidatus Aenigmarchaeota archaeon]|nr:hypothetical protein [Candidatus Aenigmarchaeota archaeon]
MKFLVALLLIASLAGGAGITGNTVQFNLAFNINDKSDDTIYSRNDLITAEDDGVVLGIASGGKKAFNSSASPTYSASDYLLQLDEALEGNRFYIIFTNGTREEVKKRVNVMGDQDIVRTTFGFPQRPPTPPAVPTFLKLVYDDVDIIGRTRWAAGPREIIIENEGTNERGMPKIRISVIR